MAEPPSQGGVVTVCAAYSLHQIGNATAHAQLKCHAQSWTAHLGVASECCRSAYQQDCKCCVYTKPKTLCGNLHTSQQCCYDANLHNALICKLHMYSIVAACKWSNTYLMLSHWQYAGGQGALVVAPADWFNRSCSRCSARGYDLCSHRGCFLTLTPAGNTTLIRLLLLYRNGMLC